MNTRKYITKNEIIRMKIKCLFIRCRIKSAKTKTSYELAAKNVRGQNTITKCILTVFSLNNDTTK